MFVGVKVLAPKLHVKELHGFIPHTGPHSHDEGVFMKIQAMLIPSLS